MIVCRNFSVEDQAEVVDACCSAPGRTARRRRPSSPRTGRSSSLSTSVRSVPKRSLRTSTMLDRCSRSSSCWLPLPSPKNERTSPTSDVSDRAAAEGHLVAQVGQLDLGAEVEPLDGAGVAQVEREGAAEDVVALERRVGEGGDLGDERVGAHEPGQRVAELQRAPRRPSARSGPWPARGRRRSRPSASRRRRRRRAARASPPRSPRAAARRSRRGAGGCPRGCSDRSAARRCSRGTARTPRRCRRCRCGSRGRTCSPSAGGCG